MATPRQRTLVLTVAFVLAIAVTFFFGYRAGRIARRVRWQNEPIRSWMSVPFVAHTHHVREDVLFDALHMQPAPGDRRPIRDIARAEKRPVADVIADIEDAIENAEGGGGTTPERGKAP
ncbi:MAG TPA: hypothetical protein VHZ74_15025 [Bryobacteraceae bacterium]|nr:hypothetical protein [Bryobacteraceae bacterium]